MTELLILRLVHVLSATIWVGSAVFGTFLLMPALQRLGAGAGPVMAGLRARGMAVFVPTVALLTILSGLRLMWIASGGFGAAYFATTRGATYAASGGAAILAFVLGFAVSRPLASRVGSLASQLESAADAAARSAVSAELSAAQRRSTVLSWVLMALLVGSAAGMAVARYLA